MDKVFGYFTFGGMVIGALFGLTWTGGSDPIIGIAIGAMLGTAIGWFAGAAFLEQRHK